MFFLLYLLTVTLAYTEIYYTQTEPELAVEHPADTDPA